MSQVDILAQARKTKDELATKVSLKRVKNDDSIALAISSTHTQGTDQGLDTGGANAVTAAQAKAAYTHSEVAHTVVGSVYINITNVNPGTELGFGTWVAIGTLTTSDATTLYVFKRTV